MSQRISMAITILEKQFRQLGSLAEARGWDLEEAARRAVFAGLALLEAEGRDARTGRPDEDLLIRWADSRGAYAALQYRYYEARESVRVADLHLAALRAENEHLRLLVERLRSSGADGGR